MEVERSNRGGKANRSGTNGRCSSTAVGEAARMQKMVGGAGGADALASSASIFSSNSVHMAQAFSARRQVVLYAACPGADVLYAQVAVHVA